MTTTKKYDIVFLAITLALLLLGFFVLSSASLGLAARTGKSSYTAVVKQIVLGGGLGFILLLITSRINYKRWKKWALPLFLTSFLLTILVLIPSLGISHGGAKRWISLGGLFSFQPAELLKFTFIIYLSSWLANRRREITSIKTGLLPFLIIVGFVGIALILQPDIGTLGVISITSALLFFLAGGRFTQIGLIIFLGIIVLSVLVIFRPYMTSRILVFLDNSYDPQGVGYQLKQAKIALGSGGIWGVGFGEGLSKFNYLPEPTGDSIFAVIGEEFGFVGTSVLIFLLLFFLYKALSIAFKTSDFFGRLLVSGIAILIVIQSFINIYAIVGLIPLTGLPLIFISQGGSALALALAEIGVILNVSKNN
jgi:cell division protein FtsW